MRSAPLLIGYASMTCWRAASCIVQASRAQLVVI
jgi:hypothetical protein